MAYNCYSRPGTPFGAKGPFYDPTIGHRGQDYTGVPAGTPVVAYEDMVIEYVGYSTGLGHVVGARLAADGKHAGWAHLRNIRSFLGGWVAAGTQFAEVAGSRDDPGTLWDGAHIHTTLTPASSSSKNAALGNTPLEDPAPRIAGSGSAAIGTPIEEDDMYNDNDRARDEKTASQVNSIWRAIYDIPVDDFSQRQTGLGRALKDIRDALFKKTTVPGSTTGSRDIPGGTLATLAAIADKLNIK